MRNNLEHQLLGIIANLERELEKPTSDTSFLETKMQDSVLIIQGNSLGLMSMARLALKLAEKGIHGSHFNFDDVTELSSCELPFEIRFVLADWDKN